MVNRRAPYLTPEGTSGSGDAYALAKMSIVVDELCYHNQTLKDDVYNIRQL